MYLRPNSKSGYEFAPGTKFLAEYCVLCGKPLSNLVSVERGTGDDCAKKYGFSPKNVDVDEEYLRDALAGSPPKMAELFLSAPDEYSGLSKVIHFVGSAWEQKSPNLLYYERSLAEIATAAGFEAVAAAAMRRYDREHLEVGQFVELEDGTIGKIDRKEESDYRSSSDKTLYRYGMTVPGKRYPVWFGKKKVVRTLRDAEATAAKKRLEKLERVQLSPEDIKAGDVLELTSGTLVFAEKTGTSQYGFYVIVKQSPQDEGTFKNLRDISRVVPSEDPEAEALRSRFAVKVDQSQVEVGSKLILKDGQERVVLGMGTSSRGFWIRTAEGFVNLPAVAEVLPPSQEGIPRDVEGLDESDRDIELDPRLFDHQVEAIERLANMRGAILGDVMGLGKTAVICHLLESPAVVVCPSSLKNNWAREIKMWRPDLSVSIDDTKRADLRADVVIVNYERLKGDLEKDLTARGNRSIAVDEAHALKNLRVRYKQKKPVLTGSNRAKSVWNLANFGGPENRRIPYVYLITGTPMPNGRFYEFFPLLNIADKGKTKLLRTFGNYCGAFCPPVEVAPGAFSYDDNSNAALLKKHADELMIRRGKDLLNLPPKSRDIVPVHMSAKEEADYQKAEKDFESWVLETKGFGAWDKASGAVMLAKLTSLRELAALGKVQYAIDTIFDYLEKRDKPLVVMAYHKSVISQIMRALKKAKVTCAKIDGTTKNRQEIVDEFQAGEIQVLVCSIVAAGVGLTLTAADTIIFVERVWRPFDLVQAEDRIHRIGQTSPASIYYLDAVGTIDERLAEVMDAKIAQTESVISAGESILADSDEEEKSIISSLLRR